VTTRRRARVVPRYRERFRARPHQESGSRRLRRTRTASATVTHRDKKSPHRRPCDIRETGDNEPPTLAGQVGLALLLAVVLLALVGPELAPYSPSQTIGAAYAPPGGRFLLGTDSGRPSTRSRTGASAHPIAEELVSFIAGGEPIGRVVCAGPLITVNQEDRIDICRHWPPQRKARAKHLLIAALPLVSRVGGGKPAPSAASTVFGRDRPPRNSR
jgi:hypothetical protein